ncbi:hypothetical protein NDU88_003065 [Pleurodeles waltl]|uniref:Uncharacterized protein n=1 Tax=Pleurodeles waltl TaxID=8319 RepID=A0AAV7UBC2_PLEWA|nr:hypothetical protein NDU88_003065 [Pleurodeles waltl]
MGISRLHPHLLPLMTLGFGSLIDNITEFENQSAARYDETLKRFPDWTADVISKLKLQFLVIDTDNDYLVGFNEFDSFLDDMEVEATVEERETYFTHVATEKTGMMDFERFLQVSSREKMLCTGE